MKIRLLKFLSKTKFESKNQFVFAKGKPTEGLFIDFRKAFDAVIEEILLNNTKSRH